MTEYCDIYHCPYYLECWEIDRCLLDEEALEIMEQSNDCPNAVQSPKSEPAYHGLDSVSKGCPKEAEE